MSDVQCKSVLIDRKTGFVYHCDNNIGQLNDSELRILIMLLEANGDVLSKDYLLEMGWPGRVVVPNSLNMAIRKIRTLFADFGDQVLIQTVARQGFRIITDIIDVIDTIELYREDELPAVEVENLTEDKYLHAPRFSYKPLVTIILLLFVLVMYILIDFIHGESMVLQCYQEDGVWLCGLDNNQGTTQNVVSCKPSELKCLKDSNKEVYIYGSTSNEKDVDAVKVK